jgi:hypothetical protein
MCRPYLVLLRSLQHGQAVVEDPEPGVPHRQPLPSGLDLWLVRCLDFRRIFVLAIYISFNRSFVSPIVRHNLRLAANVGSDDTMNWVGDFLCAWYANSPASVRHLLRSFLLICPSCRCCGPCAAAQMLRTTDKPDWDSIGDIMSNGVRVFVQPFKMVKA